jgi:hypothetical protein
MAMMPHPLWIWNLGREEIPRQRLVAGKPRHLESLEGEFESHSEST